MADGAGGFSAQKMLDQDQDIAFGFSAPSGSFDVIGFEAREAVHQIYEITVQLASQDADVDLHSLMDGEATLSIHHKYDQPRYLSGIITEAERGDSGIRRTFYTVVLRPALHRLAHISDSKIWQSATVPDILKELFETWKITNVDWRLAEKHLPREYATQYRETALAFAERLLAEEGIFYFFEHAEGNHTMVLTDAPLATPELEHAAKLTYNAQGGGSRQGSWISVFRQRERLRSNAYALNDYTFKNPSARMLEEHRRQEDNGSEDDYPLYDYPGRYKDPKTVGSSFTRHRMDAARVDATTGYGETNNIHLCAGYHFSIEDHDDAKANASHFILSVTHSGSQPAALAEDAGSDPTTYHAGFETMPARLPYRPPLGRKPIVDGPQIATVTGPAGEEIYCDNFGRVKVFFPWDRHGEEDETSSCWIRVSQSWAGGTYGYSAIPRVGHSVIVDYLEGDPDQPIITGRTYNAVNIPPTALPDNKTRTVFKTKTHKGEGFNELTFEDEAEKEFIYMHAQKDMELHVQNSRQKRVEFDDTATIGNNSFLAVAKDRVEKIDNNMDVTVTANLSEKVDGDRGLTVGGSYATKTGGDLTIKADGEIVLDATKITLVSGGTALVVSGGSVDAVPTLNVGSAAPGAVAIPPIPAILEAAAGAGTPFVSHCPLKDGDA